MKKVIIDTKTLSILLCIFLFTITSIFFIAKINFLISCLEVNSQDSFYITELNYTFPLLNIISTKSENPTLPEVSSFQTIIDYCGIDFTTPLSILNKEMPLFIKSDTPAPIESLNPFILLDKAITKSDININPTPASTPADIKSNTEVNIDNPNLKTTTKTNKPRVLIYHTHTCESYAPGPSNTTNQNLNICAVGDELEKDLETTYNISTLHDKTIHDIYGYVNSYDLSGKTLDKYLKTYGDFDLIIDMHRDSIEDKNAVTRKINKQNTAVFRFVMAKKNPHFDKNMADVNGLIGISNKIFPDLCTGIYYYNYGTNFFNQFKSNNAVLLEVGSNINTTDEAKVTARCFARVIAEYFNSKK